MIRRILCLVSAFALSACASSKVPEHTHQLAQVPIIFAALKCAFATALVRKREDHTAVKRLDGTVASGTLTLKLVHTAGTDMGLKAIAPVNPLSGPFVFALGGGSGSATPSLLKGVKKTNTIATEVPFSIFMRAKDNSVCDQTLSDSETVREDLSIWLATLIKGLDANVGYYPKGGVHSIKFSQDFAVTNTTKAGVDFNLVFVSANVGGSSERNDIQNLTFAIAPVSEKNPVPRAALD